VMLSKQRQLENKRVRIARGGAIAYARMSRHSQSQDMPDGVLSANNHYTILVTDKAAHLLFALDATRMKLHSLKAACRSWRLPGGAHIPVMSDLFVAAAVTSQLATLLGMGATRLAEET
jgi:hypothetical protein